MTPRSNSALPGRRRQRAPAPDCCDVAWLGSAPPRAPAARRALILRSARANVERDQQEFGAARQWAAGRTIGGAHKVLIRGLAGSTVTRACRNGITGAPSIFEPEPLEIASQSLAAILATWLGLTVLSRAPRDRAPRVFAWVSLLLVAWSVSILVERTTSEPATRASTPCRARVTIARPRSGPRTGPAFRASDRPAWA